MSFKDKKLLILVLITIMTFFFIVSTTYAQATSLNKQIEASPGKNWSGTGNLNGISGTWTFNGNCESKNWTSTFSDRSGKNWSSSSGSGSGKNWTSTFSGSFGGKNWTGSASGSFGGKNFTMNLFSSTDGKNWNFEPTPTPTSVPISFGP